MTTITMIGCGKMGGAMLSGWLTHMPQETRFNIIKPSKLPAPLADHPQITYAAAPADIKDDIAQSDIILFTNKPQIMDAVCQQWHGHIPDGTPVAHVCAGIPNAFLRHYFGNERPYIRIMPNTPSAIGQGMTGFYADDKTGPATKTLAQTLIAPLGQSLQTAQEEDINALAAISGSGPAYVFYLAEFLDDRAGVIEWGRAQDEAKAKAPLTAFKTAMIQGAQALGFTLEQAQTLTAQTIKGAALMMETHPDISAAQLRQDVTSPGGSTAAALDVMMDGDFLAPGKIETGLRAALARNIEMGEEQLANLK